MISFRHIAELQHTATEHWHQEPASDPTLPAEASTYHALFRLALAQHRANFDLWHHEDAARDPQAAPHRIAAVKRAIDATNQQRNDLAEQLDQCLVQLAQQNATAPLHSETPGLMVDRLSILSLKIFHTAEQAGREEAGADHQVRNHQRLALLQEQRGDLLTCLVALWEEIEAGQRRFKLYRQLKMYNDPALNPVLYQTHSPHPEQKHESS